MIGFGMLGRAELFFVVLNVAYLDFPIFTEEMFFSLTMAAMLLNISVPITISLYRPYYIRKSSETDARPLSRSTTTPIGKKAKEIVHAKASKAEHARQRRVFSVTSVDLDTSKQSMEVGSEHMWTKTEVVGSEHMVSSTESSDAVSTAVCMISRNISSDTTPTAISGGSRQCA
jgi:hypothetical protein